MDRQYIMKLSVMNTVCDYLNDLECCQSIGHY